MKFKKTICLALIVILSNFMVACNKENTEKINIKSEFIKLINKKNTKEKKSINYIANSIKINIDKLEVKNDYENKPTIVLQIKYKNVGKDNKILDSEDTILYQGNYKLKSTYDIGLNTEAFYEEIEPNQTKTFNLGYRLEGDNNFTLKFTPFLSKEQVKLELEYPKK